MPKKFADLHIHTTLSDSTFSPKEVIERAKEHKLSAIAITDHDCVDAIEPALQLAELYGIEIIPAVELSSEDNDLEVHILGYFIDWRDKRFAYELNEMRKRRIERMEKMIKKLKDHGVEINIESIFKLSQCGSIGRLHIAQAMLKGGYVKNIKEAFRKYIGDKAPCYVSGFRISPQEAIGTINRIGGIAVFAHPGTLKKEDLLLDLVSDGLKGIEVYHPDHSQADILHYLKIATKYKLLVTGGSDCHGFGKEHILLGSVRIPYEFVEELKDAAKR
ncbi:MAG: PHP domain-containing protein [Candidatus Omnitrophica bacterium]|nr:PHP domain-containing protein [Candidatus Omnitrophota bacterium]